jgi:hypothetical protein
MSEISEIYLTYLLCRFVSISMGLCACNSAGHLSNHADIAPNHAGITFAVSNTIVSFTFSYYPIFKITFNNLIVIT